jgi:hypothetical protein
MDEMAPQHFLLEWNHHTGWIMCRVAREGALVSLCWLPPDRRGKPFDHNGTHAVVGASQGTVTIIDFRDVLRILQRSGTV